MYRGLRRNLAVLLLSAVCVSQVACTTGTEFELNGADVPMYSYDYGNPYYAINQGYYWSAGTPYYYRGDYRVYHDGYRSDYHGASPAMDVGGFSARR